MKKDRRQLRTTNGKGLIGYNARKDGVPCIAIMKGDVSTPDACCGTIPVSELIKAMESSPYIDLDNGTL